MNIDFINRLEKLDYLIRIKGTGNPKKLSERLHISERSVYGYLEVLRTLGAPIVYDKARQSYKYEEAGYFMFRFNEQTF